MAAEGWLGFEAVSAAEETVAQCSSHEASEEDRR